MWRSSPVSRYCALPFKGKYRSVRRCLPLGTERFIRETLASALLLLCLSFVTAHESKDDTNPVVLAPGYSDLSFDAPKPGSYFLPSLGRAADARFVDSHENSGTLYERYAVRATLLSFIFAQCSDVNGCPLASYVMRQVAQRLAEDVSIRDRVRLISFSFDLAHDTPANPEEYARSFRREGIDWDFVVAPDHRFLANTLAPYEQSVQVSDGHTFAHILRVFLIDPEFRIRTIYSTAFLHADTLASDIGSVLAEQRNSSISGKSDVDAIRNIHSSEHAMNPELGLPDKFAHAATTPTPTQVRLGERLFFDRRLSLNKTISCAMCHVPDQGFSVNELATAVGIEGRTVKRNAPTLLNVAYLRTLFHDARETRLETQVWSLLLADNEMDNPSVGHVIDTVNALPGYRDQFRIAFNAAVTMRSIGSVLAAYQRTLIAAGSPYDQYTFGKDDTALSPAAKCGLALFRGKANCAACHTIDEDHALFTDQAVHNTGIGYRTSMGTVAMQRRVELSPGIEISYVAASAERRTNDLGRYEVSQDPDDR